MQRNFRLIFNAILFIFIFIDIIILIFLTLDFAFNLKAAVGLVRFDVFASLLILFHASLRLSIQENKREYITKNWFDIFAIIPLAYIVILIFPNTYLIVIALFLLRIYALYRYMLKIRSIIGFTRKTKLDYATFVLLLTLIFGSLIFFWVESPVNPQASTLDNSVFFMIVTMSTVGYGNIVPYTGIGKMVAVIAIIVGLGYTGWVTAAIASSLVEEFRKKSKEEITEQRESMSIILNKLDKIEKELEEIKNRKDSE
ncbi:MAG TPA: ion channel [Methanobacterium sp.]|nr:ion channel [Methanobacterium sp.]